MAEVFNLPTKEQFDTMNSHLANISIPDAAKVTIEDTGSHYTSGNVEGALQEVGEQINDLAYKGIFATISALQSIPNNAETNIAFNSALRQVGFTFWDVGNPTRLTIPTGVSRIRLVAQVGWAHNATGVREIKIYKNGIPLVIPYAVAVGNPVLTKNGVSTPLQVLVNEIEVTAGDYFELNVFQNSGGALNVESTSRVTYLALEVVA